MANTLVNYLNKRLADEKGAAKGRRDTTGPVITISREVGCNGLKLAHSLSEKLNVTSKFPKWKVLSKEVFYESARELDLDPEKVRQFFKKSDKYTFEQILKAFGDKRYKSEVKIANTVRDVVRSLAEDGHNIIVGRASHIIANNMKNALHLRLTAPLEYRISNIMDNNGLNYEEANAFIAKVEKERISFRKTLKSDSLHAEYFDLIINRSSFSTEQAIDLILKAAEQKGILHNENTPKIMYY